jgi:hypothetical protein
MASPVSLEEVDIRADLLTRPYRAPNYEGETRALALLARELAANPRNMLQRLVETALELCQADTAGISILEGDVFRWEALAGVFAGYGTIRCRATRARAAFASTRTWRS